VKNATSRITVILTGLLLRSGDHVPSIRPDKKVRPIPTKQDEKDFSNG
jgi:hypothetical protein